MYKHLFVVVCLLFATNCFAQEPNDVERDSAQAKQDSIKRIEFIKKLGNGYLPFKYFNLDLRYLIKFNQYEGFRTGLGGITNEKFSKRYRLNGYMVYGFKDKRYKYSIGGGFRIHGGILGD